ncbi:MAG: GntR family transcriptional regulator [Reyranella sp.]|nr:GntR family transcriptional regulator [Reyranella sp.]
MQVSYTSASPPPLAAEDSPRRGGHGPSSPDLVVSAIKRGILIGRYVPGQRLIEADLTRDLRVSRGPVREAFKRLAAEGVVALSPHRGAYIRWLTRSEVNDLLQVLNVMIGLAAQLAAMHIGSGDNRQRLAAAFERLDRHGPAGDPVPLAVDRTGFYDAIFDIAGNRELTRMNPVVPTLILRMQVFSYSTPHFRAHQFADYRLLYDAINRGDARQARRIVERHVRGSQMQIRRLPDEAFASEAS